MTRSIRKGLIFGAVVVAIAAAIWLVSQYGFDVETLRQKVRTLGIWAPLMVFLLRLISIVIPAIPGTPFSLLAGLSFGLWQGLLVILSAGFVSCSICFFLSRRYGKTFVTRLIGPRFMARVERLGERHLEQNFFLLTAFMLTGFFDFVSYGVGLTKTSWNRFVGALLVSIPIAHSPAVAIGAEILKKDKSYMVLGAALLIAFGVATISGMVQRPAARESGEPSD